MHKHQMSTTTSPENVIEQLQKEKDEVLQHANEILEQSIVTPGERLEAFGTFATDNESFFTPYTSINMQEYTTIDGRFLRFFDGNAGQLIIVLFQNGKNQLISVNDRVLKLETFLQISDLEHIDNTVESQGSNDLRGGVHFVGSVRAMAKKEPIIFKNTTIPLIMKAMCYLSKN